MDSAEHDGGREKRKIDAPEQPEDNEAENNNTAKKFRNEMLSDASSAVDEANQNGDNKSHHSGDDAAYARGSQQEEEEISDSKPSANGRNSEEAEAVTEKSQRDEKRLEINRQRAKEIRKRKKKMLEEMQKQIVLLTMENNKLRVQNQIQQNEISLLRNAIKPVLSNQQSLLPRHNNASQRLGNTADSFLTGNHGIQDAASTATNGNMNSNVLSDLLRAQNNDSASFTNPSGISASSTTAAALAGMQGGLQNHSPLSNPLGGGVNPLQQQIGGLLNNNADLGSLMSSLPPEMQSHSGGGGGSNGGIQVDRGLQILGDTTDPRRAQLLLQLQRGQSRQNNNNNNDHSAHDMRGRGGTGI